MSYRGCRGGGDVADQTEGAQHRAGVRLVLTGNVKGTAVPDTREQHAGADGKRRSVAPGKELHRNMALVMIDCDKSVDILTAQDDVGADRAFGQHACVAQPRDRRRGDAVIIISEQAVFTRMRVDAEYANPRIWYAELLQG